MKRALLVLALILTLTACEDHRDQQLRLAIECDQAGGNWVTTGKGGAWESTYQTCEFRNN